MRVNKIFAKGLFRISLLGARNISGDFASLKADNLTHFDMRKSNVQGDISACSFNNIDTWSFLSYDIFDTDNGFITHTAPTFCYPQVKRNYLSRLANHENLEVDVRNQRLVIDSIYNKLIADKHPLKDWLYGHFHSSHVEFIGDVRFSLLDIEEFKELRNI